MNELKNAFNTLPPIRVLLLDTLTSINSSIVDANTFSDALFNALNKLVSDAKDLS